MRTLRARQLSRNRHFAEHLSPVVKRARAMLRYLRSVEADVLAAESITTRRRGDTTELELNFPAVRFRRVLVLDKEQLALLCEQERCAERLGSYAAAVVSGAR